MTYSEYIKGFEQLYLSARRAKEVVLPKLEVSFPEKSKKILVIAPHPDDECLMSGFAIRAQDEWGSEVYVLPFSYGSNLDRQNERKRELTHAVSALGFTVIDPRSPQFSELTREEILSVLESLSPEILIIPHAQDGHPTHIRCSTLSMTLAKEWVKQKNKTLIVLESEFWMNIENPNLLIPLTGTQVSKIGEALSLHVGEVSRNPYHLSLPAYFMEQKRRGSEKVLGLGSKIEDFVFAQSYRKTILRP